MGTSSNLRENFLKKVLSVDIFYNAVGDSVGEERSVINSIHF